MCNDRKCSGLIRDYEWRRHDDNDQYKNNSLPIMLRAKDQKLQ